MLLGLYFERCSLFLNSKISFTSVEEIVPARSGRVRKRRSNVLM